MLEKEEKICAICGEDHEKIRDLCRKSLFATARILCNFKDMNPRFHGRLARWVEKNMRTGNRKMMVLAPRDHLKSSLLSIAGCIWLGINRPEVRVLIVQASAEKAKDIMNSLRKVLESDSMRHFFPELSADAIKKAGLRFNETAIELPRKGVFPDGEATFSARGVTSTMVGGHFDVHIFDDVIDDQIAASSLELDRVFRWFKNSPPLFVDPMHGIRFVIGTCWSMNDMYQHIKRAGTHAVFEVGAYMDARAEALGFTGYYDPSDPYSGDSMWPERFPRKSLQQIRKDMMDDAFFSFQYLNIPVAEGLKRFTDSMIVRGEWRTYGQELHFPYRGTDRVVQVGNLNQVFILADPSLGERAESDEFGVVVGGWDPYTPCGVFLEVYHGRIPPKEQADVLLQLAKKWKMYDPQIGIERAGMSSLQEWLEEAMRQSGQYFYVFDLRPGVQRKTRRIEAMQPFFASGQVVIMPEAFDMIPQLLGFQPRPDGSTGLAHDDIIDAAAYHVMYWRGKIDEGNPDFDADIDDWSTADPTQSKQPLYGLSLED